ncbi:ribonuclease R [Propionispora vibrioides]|uniref:Ribonuclease R n=1 Tax=Propionispora vibrioides TaxID=112903 RepID=A0A1H8RND4_9FIRM|nr:ribonuclease R [Propionispora vibrioides]SEO67797.1 ribonuclease R [Propionispora vibrioides]
MELKDKIAAFMRTEAYKPLTVEELAGAMELEGEELSDFWQVLRQMEEDALIIRTRYGKYGVPERMNLVVGRLSLNSKGFGFVIPETPGDAPEAMSDVFIPPDGLLTAMHRDRVVARLHQGKTQDGKRQEGEIIRVVERANARIVGTFEANRSYGFLVPDDMRIKQDVFIAQQHFGGAKTGNKVVVEIIKWPEKKRSAEGKVVEILGDKGDTGIEILSIIKSHNLPTEFPPEVLAAAEQVPSVISEAEIAGRRDLRHLPIVTIDGEDAKDLDDGVHVERLNNGHYLLGVHIADVSYYVRENSPLDKEARERGTSVYLADRVLPMLPQRLSNGICSLNANEDRLAMSAHMEIDRRGQVVAYDIFPSVIRVKRRLSYTIVRKILEEEDEALREEFREFLLTFSDMEELCRILRNRRLRRGAIDFEFSEIKVKLDEAGRPVDIVKRVRSIAESIIEEFMLVANETVAEHMYRRNNPSLYRIHEEPEQEKMVKLNTLLQTFGLSLRKMDEIKPMVLQRVLSRVAGRPEERIISTVMLRSLKQARYDAVQGPHFGLAAEFYSHFTSPIRRYPDLVLHRLLRDSFLTGGKITGKRRDKLAAILPGIAAHSSERERAAADAERETVDLKKAEYMTRFVDQEFDGIISSVTAFGIFVELDNGVEGLVHVSTMDDDYYQYVEEQYALIGEHTRKVYRLGDSVSVVLVKVNLDSRTLDFCLTGTTHRVVERRQPRQEKEGRPKRKREEKAKTPVKNKKKRNPRTGVRRKKKPAKE